MTRDTWHVKHCGGWTFSKHFSPLALTVEGWRFGRKGSVTQLISDEGVCRTALATPVLLYIQWENNIKRQRTNSIFHSDILEPAKYWNCTSCFVSWLGVNFPRCTPSYLTPMWNVPLPPSTSCLFVPFCVILHPCEGKCYLASSFIPHVTLFNLIHFPYVV